MDGDRRGEVAARYTMMRALSWTQAELDAVLDAWDVDADDVLSLIDPY